MIPSFVSSRREAPISTTENFAKSTARLAAVQTVTTESAAIRNRAKSRRRQVLFLLFVSAAATLGIAIWTGSWAWLVVSLVFDAAIAAYVAMLLTMRRSAEEAALAAAVVPTIPERPEVRVVAG